MNRWTRRGPEDGLQHIGEVIADVLPLRMQLVKDWLEGRPVDEALIERQPPRIQQLLKTHPSRHPNAIAKLSFDELTELSRQYRAEGRVYDAEASPVC